MDRVGGSGPRVPAADKGKPKEEVQGAKKAGLQLFGGAAGATGTVAGGLAGGLAVGAASAAIGLASLPVLPLVLVVAAGAMAGGHVSTNLATAAVRQAGGSEDEVRVVRRSAFDGATLALPLAVGAGTGAGMEAHAALSDPTPTARESGPDRDAEVIDGEAEVVASPDKVEGRDEVAASAGQVEGSDGGTPAPSATEKAAEEVLDPGYEIGDADRALAAEVRDTFMPESAGGLKSGLEPLKLTHGLAAAAGRLRSLPVLNKGWKGFDYAVRAERLKASWGAAQTVTERMRGVGEFAGGLVAKTAGETVGASLAAPAGPVGMFAGKTVGGKVFDKVGQAVGGEVGAAVGRVLEHADPQVFGEQLQSAMGPTPAV